MSVLMLVVLFLGWMSGAATGQTSSEEEAIVALLEAQSDAWNRGDLDGFMEAYEKSPETAYVGGGLVQGYDAIKAGYKKRYADKSRMGKLNFLNPKVRILGDGVATVVARFDLERSTENGGPAAGIFTLVLKESEAGWKIIHDHTTGGPTKPAE